jgi:hypothetical protein
MKNLTFVLWMLGFRGVAVLDGYVQTLSAKTYSDTTEALSSLISLIIWGFVGYKLYEPATNETKQ